MVDDFIGGNNSGCLLMVVIVRWQWQKCIYWWLGNDFIDFWAGILLDLVGDNGDNSFLVVVVVAAVVLLVVGQQFCGFLGGRFVGVWATICVLGIWCVGQVMLDLIGSSSGFNFVGGYDGEVIVLKLKMLVCWRWRQ